MASGNALWFFGSVRRRGGSTHHVLVRFDPESSTARAFALPANFGAPYTPGNLITTSDGALWYGAQHIVGKHPHQHGSGLVRFDTQLKTFTSYQAPNGYGWAWNLAARPGGSIWATAADAVYELAP